MLSPVNGLAPTPEITYRQYFNRKTVAPARVLVVGSGGREHALAWKLGSERGVADISWAPGNAGINRIARCVLVDAGDPHAIAAIARREEIDLTIVGPELPLSPGV